MAKQRTLYVCQACGHNEPKWLGRCPACQAWSTLLEQPKLAAATAGSSDTPLPPPQITTLSEIRPEQTARLGSGIAEFDRVLGGGLVPGALILVGGDPGIGKSTLLLQALAHLARSGESVLYVSGEESPGQIKLRAERLGLADAPLPLLAENRFEIIAEAHSQLRPKVWVVDSIQTVGLTEMASTIGSVAQIKAITHSLLQIAKNEGSTTFVIGHVTKEGTIAGPRLMEHMVDAVLYFEGERSSAYRLLRAHKNRFGSAQEIGLFEMGHAGLVPLADPSALFLSQRASGPGAMVITSMEGSRPILLEVQALVTPALYGGTPRRNTTGFEAQRAAMLCAVLAARGDIDLAAHDVFVNVAGGVRLQEPAADLGIALALASAARKVTLPADWVAIGEVGLGGEIRNASQMGRRLHEAATLGFKTALVPKDAALTDSALACLPLENIAQALDVCGIASQQRSAAPRRPGPL